jgi:hypothetical protein
MNTLTVEAESFIASNISVSEDHLTVELTDGRIFSIPISWFPRLQNATIKERRNFRLIGGGIGIHWPDIDEDISIEGLVLGRPSGESQTSLERWLKHRKEKSGSKAKR